MTTNESALFDVLRSRDITGVKQLLKDGDVSLNRKNESGYSMLGAAATDGFTDGVRLLLKAGSDVNMSDFYGQTAIQYASDGGHLETLMVLVEHGGCVDRIDDNKIGLSALHLATLNNHTDVVRYFIQNKCDVNATDINGVSVLHCAVGNNHPDIVEELLRAKVRVNVQGINTGRTPLFVAAELGDVSMIKRLVKSGARVNISNDYNMTPLCAVCLQNNTEVALYLLQSGAGSKVNHHDNKGCLALHYAARFGNVAVMEALIDKGSRLDEVNTDGETALHQAIRSEQVMAVQTLIIHGCDVNASHQPGYNTPLHVAVQSVTDRHKFSDILQALIMAGVTMDTCNDVMETPLYRALSLGKEEFVSLLLQYGADSTIDCPHDTTLLQQACRRDYVHLIDLILHCELSWSRETWLDTDIYMSGISEELLAGFARGVPTVLRNNRPLYLKILDVRSNPRRLVDICRWIIRRNIGDKLEMNLSRTLLPRRLQEFVLLKTL